MKDIENILTFAPICGIEELNLDEVAFVSGGRGQNSQAASQGAYIAGGALATISGSSFAFALVPTPFSPVFVAFGVASGLAGAAFGLIGALTAGGNIPNKPHYQLV